MLNHSVGKDTEEAAFLKAYDPRDYPPVAVTVDVVVLTIREGRLCVLLIRRGLPPFAGAWALPGGFLRTGAGAGEDQGEDLHMAAARELAEETGLFATGYRQDGRSDRIYLEQLATYGRPGRDPRMRVVTVAYVALARDLAVPLAGSDAREAAWIAVEDVLPHAFGDAEDTERGDGWDLAFDHARILTDGVRRVRSKMQYTPIATALLEDEFTLGDLHEVYEIVLGERLHVSNFRRKVLSTAGFVEEIGATVGRANPRGGPRTQKLYRAGPARRLYPGFIEVPAGRRTA